MSEKIIICSKCNGEGVKHCNELTDYHKGIYRHWDEVCEKCEGSGRLLETTTVKTKPYKPTKIEG